MRFYHIMTLSSLVLVFLISDIVLGAQSKGRYMWLKCRPDSKNSNCVEQKGPRVNLPQQKPVKMDIPLESSEESSETGESGDGSGDFLNLPYISRKKRDSGPEEQLQQILSEEEGSSGDVDYPNFISSGPEKHKLSAEDLLKDNIIE